jgi:hypothetical protein
MFSNHGILAGGVVQRKLVIGQPNDQFERQADQVADKVMRMPDNAGDSDLQVGRKSNHLLQRKCSCGAAPGATGECEQCRKRRLTLQRRAANSHGCGAVPPIVHEVLSSSGNSLDPATRAYFEPRFGYDFSGVRTHTDAKAVDSARAVNALAYTVGRDVVFGAGQYTPGTSQGRKLMAHELTHVIQQSRGGSYPMLDPSAVHEHNAEAVSDAIAAGQFHLVVQEGTSVGLARAEGPGLTLVPLSAEELMKWMFTQRGFGSSQPGAPEFDPKGIGKPAGKGFETYAAIQIIDKEGAQVRIGVGAYLGGGGEHGEAGAIAALRQGLPKDRNIRGGKMMVVTEQTPCAGCDSAIRRFGQELGVKYEVYVPERQSLTSGRPVTPKQASRTAFQGERPPTRAKLIISENYIGGGQPSPPAAPSIIPKERPPTGTAATGAGAPIAETGTPATRRGVTTAGGQGTSELSAEARAVARSVAAEVATDFRLLRAARVLTTAANVLQVISALQMLDDFINMTSSSLAGKGFILIKEIAQSEALKKRAQDLAKDYASFSDSLVEKQFKLFKVSVDPLSAGQVASSLFDLKMQLDNLHLDLPERISRINKALKEAEAKRRAAESILEDPKASSAIAAATFGTQELARLFAVSQDLSRIAGALRGASTALQSVRDQLDIDQLFVNGWFDTLFAACEKGGFCSSKTFNIPFIGPSTWRFSPGGG